MLNAIKNMKYDSRNSQRKKFADKEAEKEITTQKERNKVPSQVVTL
jgi:hypothetical protein